MKIPFGKEIKVGFKDTIMSNPFYKSTNQKLKAILFIKICHITPEGRGRQKSVKKRSVTYILKTPRSHTYD